LESLGVPAAFLHNCAAIMFVMLLSIFIHVRWLVIPVAWVFTIAGSFLWMKIGFGWYSAWYAYCYSPVIGGSLLRSPTTERKIIGLLIFWLLPLALAYAAAVARIAKRTN